MSIAIHLNSQLNGGGGGGGGDIPWHGKGKDHINMWGKPAENLWLWIPVRREGEGGGGGNVSIHFWDVLLYAYEVSAKNNKPQN